MMKSKMLTTIALLGAVGVGGQFVPGTVSDAVAQTATVSAQNMTPHASARDHTGKNVFTQGGAEIGKIKNMVKGSAGPEVYAIVSLGGPVMASMERDVLIPAAQISFTSDRAVMTTQATKDLVKAMPVYKVDTTTQVTQ